MSALYWKGCHGSTDKRDVSSDSPFSSTFNLSIAHSLPAFFFSRAPLSCSNHGKVQGWPFHLKLSWWNQWWDQAFTVLTLNNAGSVSAAELYIISVSILPLIKSLLNHYNFFNGKTWNWLWNKELHLEITCFGVVVSLVKYSFPEFQLKSKVWAVALQHIIYWKLEVCYSFCCCCTPENPEGLKQKRICVWLLGTCPYQYQWLSVYSA